MATSLLLMASNKTSTHDNTMKPLYGSEETKAEPSRNRGRSRANGKGSNQKKQPQRGLGVAQLERLRIQESWRKMTETSASPVPPFPEQHHHLLQCHRPQSLPFAVPDPFGSVPVRYGTAADHGPLQGPSAPVINGNTLGMPGQSQTMRNNHRVGSNLPGGGNGGLLVMNPLNMIEPFGFGAPTPGSCLLFGSPLETSKELSSMPNVHSESERCDLCHKKKRVNEENVMGYSNATRDKPSDLWPIVNGADFLEFGPQQSPNLTGGTNGFTTRAARHAGAPRNLDECVEVVAIHKKGNSMNGQVFMEYEFFPVEKDGRGTSSNEQQLPAVASVAVGLESSSSITAATYGDSDSNNIDLSLKLSY